MKKADGLKTDLLWVANILFAELGVPKKIVSEEGMNFIFYDHLLSLCICVYDAWVITKCDILQWLLYIPGMHMPMHMILDALIGYLICTVFAGAY